ncbi:MAG: hypothetical protein WC935_04240 [Thermoleophilia bacterium]
MMHWEKSKQIFCGASTLFFGTLAAFILGTLIAGCGYNAGSFRNDSTLKDAPDPPLLTQEYLQETVSGSFGKTIQVRHVTLSGEGMDKIVEVGVDRPATCGNGSVEGIMASSSGKAMAYLFEYPEISRVTVIMYGVDQGINSNEIAVRVVVKRTTAKDIDWSMFGPMTMSSMVDEYYIYPKLQTFPTT